MRLRRRAAAEDDGADDAAVAGAVLEASLCAASCAACSFRLWARDEAAAVAAACTRRASAPAPLAVVPLLPFPLLLRWCDDVAYTDCGLGTAAAAVPLVVALRVPALATAAALRVPG